MKPTPLQHAVTARGYLMLTALIFGTIFVTVLGALASFTLSENRLQVVSTAQNQAFAIAEAGLEYYRWHLAHYPTDLQNGTGAPGPYVINYSDPEGGVIGTYTLDIGGNTSCGQTLSVDISSTGTVAGDPGSSRTVVARYSKPTVADYSFVLNSDVWAGADRTINGPYHSNYGIRMDGTANSPVTSSVSTWNCTSSFGCSPTNATAPGVTGTGPNQTLWEYPVPQVPFDSIAADFASLKTLAQANGVYLERYSTTNGQGDPAYSRGYHLTFNADDTITVKQVSSTNQLSVTPVNPADGNTDRALINNESNTSTSVIAPDCGLVFVEDNVWIDGVVSNKVTLVAANVVNANIKPNVFIRNNITYASSGAGLTVIAANNILIAPNVPNTLTLNGVFIAQGGSFGMNAYACNSGYATKTGSLTILGTTVSNKRTGTQWTSTCGGYNKGFQTRVDSYDRNLAGDPPPFTPVVSDDFRFIDWREQ